jgi:hypothetical protein
MAISVSKKEAVLLEETFRMFEHVYHATPGDFEPARKLYTKFGFINCAPFGAC